jgi:hypothetical protein
MAVLTKPYLFADPPTSASKEQQRAYKSLQTAVLGKDTKMVCLAVLEVMKMASCIEYGPPIPKRDASEEKNKDIICPVCRITCFTKSKLVSHVVRCHPRFMLSMVMYYYM